MNIIKSFVEKYKEFLKTDSNLSSMRLGFFWTIRTALFIAIITPILSFAAIMFGKAFDVAAIVALVALLLTTAFGGKSIQSFAEKETPTNKE